MSDETADSASGAGSFEVRSSREIQRDEDVLSSDLRAALESVGSTVGVIAAVALVFSQLTRARGFVARATKPATTLPSGAPNE